MKIPKWHAAELARREKLVREGKDKFLNLADVKKRLQRHNRNHPSVSADQSSAQ